MQELYMGDGASSYRLWRAVSGVQGVSVMSTCNAVYAFGVFIRDTSNLLLNMQCVHGYPLGHDCECTLSGGQNIARHPFWIGFGC